MKISTKSTRYRGYRETPIYNFHGQAVWEECEGLLSAIASVEKSIDGLVSSIDSLHSEGHEIAHLLALQELMKNRKD